MHSSYIERLNLNLNLLILKQVRLVYGLQVPHRLDRAAARTAKEP